MTSEKEWFEEWFDSPYYHLLYRDRDEAEARAFLDRLLSVLQPAPGARVLDLACGRGRYATYLAEHGFDVTGLDLSTNNIRYARPFERENLYFYTHDMRLPFRSNYYDYILNIFTSFGYFRKERDHLKTLSKVRAGLRSTGFFILDYLNSPTVIKSLRPLEEKTIAGIHFHLRKYIDNGRVIKEIDFRDQGQDWHFVEKVRLFTLEELKDLFNQAGLRVVHTYGDYLLRPFEPDSSPRLILIARKDDGTTAI